VDHGTILPKAETTDFPFQAKENLLRACLKNGGDAFPTRPGE
jgi:hypothetical protein